MTPTRMTPFEAQLRTRLAEDFTYYAPRCLRISPKAGELIPLRLNTAQAYLHQQIESQKQRTGKVRVLVLKGRQQGVSSYTEGRFFWLTTHTRNCRAFILTHLDMTTTAVFNMAKRFYDHCPIIVKPSRSASNSREIVFDKLDSGYRVSTAGSESTGHGLTLQLFHGSEVALWPHADAHLSGVLQAVPDLPGTEVILESTSQGPYGMFYQMCMAAQRGEGEYQLVFIPWFWQTEYRKALPTEWELSADELDYKTTYNLDDEQIAWRRAKIVEMNGISQFRRMYPATVEEAFNADAVGALWTREQINNLRVREHPPLTRIVVAIDPSGGDKEKNDEVGIVVMGIDSQKQGYVLADHTGRYSPEVWGSKAVALYRHHQADRIVAEANFGGDMVRHTIHTVDRSAPVKIVHASRSKQARAEPVAALYEQGRIHHVGHLNGLEDEMVTWVPPGANLTITDRAASRSTTDSPNRVDALVWAASELMVDGPGTATQRPLHI